MLKMKVTDREKAFLLTIHHYIKSNGFPPSVRDLCAILKISSTNGVRYFLGQLVKKGLISIQPKIARGIKIESKGLELTKQR